MSLSSKLAGKNAEDKEFQEILKEILPQKEKFKTVSGEEAFSTNTVDKAPYNLSNKYYSSLVGIAFDYLARFTVAHIITENKEKAYLNLASNTALRILENSLDDKLYKSIEEKYVKGLVMVMEYIHIQGGKLQNKDFIEHINGCVFKAYRKFINKISWEKYWVNKEYKIDIEELIKYTCFLAKLEQITRSGILPENPNTLLDDIEREIIVDIKQLYDIFVKDFTSIVYVDSLVIFNPKFGELSSLLVGGADADIYIDCTLYDFKVQKDNGYKWKDVAQLVGYYILSLITIIFKEENSELSKYPISRLAFYKGRKGEIEYIDVKDIGSKNIINALKKLDKLWNLKLNNELYKSLEDYIENLNAIEYKSKNIK